MVLGFMSVKQPSCRMFNSEGHMSVFVGLRLPDLLSARLDEEAAVNGKNRSKTIIAILERALMAPTERGTAAPAKRVVSKLPAAVQPLVTTARDLPLPIERTICPRCDGKLIVWGPQMRCESCNQNWPTVI